MQTKRNSSNKAPALKYKYECTINVIPKPLGIK